MMIKVTVVLAVIASAMGFNLQMKTGENFNIDYQSVEVENETQLIIVQLNERLIFTTSNDIVTVYAVK